MVGLDSLTGGASTVRAQVKVGGAPLRPDVEHLLSRVVVDTHLHLPDMFELTFLDEAGSAASDAGAKIGASVEVYGGAPDSKSAKKLIEGEVTSIEAICEDLHIYTVVRGYEKAHRLQKARKSRTFLNSTDSEIAKKIAGEAKLSIGTVDSTSATHDYIAQVAQTDWDFLKQRARENGYEVGVAGGKFYFRRPPGMPGGGGGLGGLAAAAASAVGGMLGMGSSALTFKDNLISFMPRVTAAGLTPEVEVRVWDPKQAKTVSSKTKIRTGSAELSGQDPAALADSFGGFPSLPGGLSAIVDLLGLGPIASGQATTMTDRPLAAGSAASAAADEVAKGLAEHVASTFAEAEGYCVGSPDVQAGARVQIKGVPKTFEGTWTVTNARHIFDEAENGYHTRFFVSGRQERSLLGLASGGASQGERTQIPGLVCGLVTNVNDPDKLKRVKVALPWLSAQYETDWARVVQLGGGKKSGGVFTPEVGDEVLVGFEFGDPRRAYVIGGLANSKTTFDLGGETVKAMGLGGTVVQRGFITPAGNRLVFADEMPPAGPPMKSKFSLETADGGMGMVVDQTGGSLKITCNPKPPASQTPTGSVEITVGQAGTISIKAGSGGTVTIDGGNNLELKAMSSVKIQSQGVVEIKGTQIKLN